jgi:hypothetical protein
MPEKSFSPKFEYALAGPDDITRIKMPNFYNSGKIGDVWGHKLNFVGQWDKALYNFYNQDCPGKTGGK